MNFENLICTDDKVSGIYTIRNNISGKIYVGSSKEVSSRLKRHKNLLILNKHPNRYLQYSWNKNKGNFEFLLLEAVPIEFLASQETYWINLLDSFNLKKGYNLDTDGYSRKSFNQEIRNKLSQSCKIRYLDDNNIVGNKFIRAETKTEYYYFRSLSKATQHFGLSKGAINYAILYNEGLLKKNKVIFKYINKEEFLGEK